MGKHLQSYHPKAPDAGDARGETATATTGTLIWDEQVSLKEFAPRTERRLWGNTTRSIRSCSSLAPARRKKAAF